MTKYLALWYVATTLLLVINALSRRSVIALGLVVGLVAMGGYKLKKIQSNRKIVIATVSLAAVILAGLVIPIVVTELSRNFAFQDQFVLSVSALGIIVVLGTAIELTKQIRAAEA